MALFFFVIGLEIKRELVVGELRDRRAATLPVLAAVGGVVVPALIYLAVVRDGEAIRGWASRWPPTSRSPLASSRCWAGSLDRSEAVPAQRRHRRRHPGHRRHRDLLHRPSQPAVACDRGGRTAGRRGDAPARFKLTLG